MHGLSIEPVLWSVIYPVHPNDPIGWIRRCPDGFHARMEREALGVYLSGDSAVEAIWGRFLERNRVEHEVAARTHGSYERH